MAKKLDQLLSRIPRGTFATVGGALGGPTGAMIGKGISTLTGYGDYNVRANSLMNRTVIGEMADQVPMFKQQGADTRLKHCEYVADIVVPNDQYDYNVVTYNIDPTNSDTFPWLASVAKKYQRYKVRGMVVGYRSTSTDYQNSGVVAIAVNYDAAERSYDSMEGLLNTKFAVSTKPSNSMLAPVECDPSRSPLDGYYVRHVTSVDDTDASKRQTIMGKINVATSGLTLTPGTTIGQLYISYDIEFLYPYLHKSQVTDPGSAAMGLVNYATPVTHYASITDLAYGNLQGFSVSGDPKKVMVKYNASPESTILPTGASLWQSFIFPQGTWILQYSEGAWYGGVGSSVLGGGTVVTASHGNAIKIDLMREDNDDTSVWSQYTLTVGKGSVEDRTFYPAGMVGRVQTGSTTYLDVGMFATPLQT